MFQRNQAGLDRMVDVRLADEDIIDRSECCVDFGKPATFAVVDQMVGDKCPDPTVPDLECGIIAD